MTQPVSIYQGVPVQVDGVVIELLSGPPSVVLRVTSETKAEEVGVANPGLLMRAMERRGMRAGK
jgi:hypothetical protein